jgi:hypothetical protein
MRVMFSAITEKQKAEPGVVHADIQSGATYSCQENSFEDTLILFETENLSHDFGQSD